MKKKVSALCAALLLLLSLAACGGSQGMYSADSSFSPSGDSMTFEENSDMDLGWEIPYPDEPAEAAAQNSGGSGYGGLSSGGVPDNAKIIYTASMSLETKEFDAASKALTDAVEELGGYFESRSVSQGGYYRSLNCTVRVPVENFTAFLDRAGEAAHVTDRSEYLDDVSEAYYDQEARLTTQRTKLERLQELLSQAENMEDIITIESAISETELQIEYLTGSLRKYDSQINFSTVNLSLYEVYRLSTDEEAPVTFGQRFASAFSTGFHRGVEGLEDFAVSMARNWMTLLILAAILAAVILLLRRCNRKKKEQAAPIPPKPEKHEAEKPAEKKED